MISDQRIRAALERMADRAPDPERLQAAISRHSRVHRQRRALLVAGGTAAAAGAVAVPAALALRPTGTSVAAPGPAALSYRPAWLPDGLVEEHREVSVRSGRTHREVRHWLATEQLLVELGFNRPPDAADLADPAPHPAVSLQLLPSDAVDLADRTSAVTIAGIEGGLFADGTSRLMVAWPVDDGRMLAVAVEGFDELEPLAVRIAESVVADGEAVVESPAHPGWLPDSVDATHYALTASAGDYGDVDTSLTLGEGPGPHLGIRIAGRWGGASSPMKQRRYETFRGRSLLLYQAANRWHAHLGLDDGRHLMVNGAPSITDDDLLRVCETLHINPPPDPGWTRR